jgi:hypothetical protein
MVKSESSFGGPDTWERRRRIEEADDKSIVSRTLEAHRTTCERAVQYLLAMAGIPEVEGIHARRASFGPLSHSGVIAFINEHRDFNQNPAFGRAVSLAQRKRISVDEIQVGCETGDNSHIEEKVQQESEV